MQYVQGWLLERTDAGFGNRPGGPVDPGYGVDAGNRPDNSLPPGVPPIGSTLPEPPPGIWPPPSYGRPIVPIGPDNTLPVPPGTIWPSPGRPPHIDHGLPNAPARPDQGLPGGGLPDNALPSQTFWMLCYTPTLGWRFIAVDPSLRPGTPLPPTAQPK